jgi:hypothetical protein
VTFSFPELLEIEKKQAIPMRTAIVTSSGIVLLVAFVAASSYLGGTALRVGAICGFILVWLLFCIADWAFGVFKAGYPASEELKIHAIVFGLPALLAVLLIWKFWSAP